MVTWTEVIIEEMCQNGRNLGCLQMLNLIGGETKIMQPVPLGNYTT